MAGVTALGQIPVAMIALPVAFVGGLVLTPLAKKLAWRFGAVSEPDGKRRLHARPTPLWGGSAVYLAALLSVIASFLLASVSAEDKLPAALALSAGMLCLLGFYDDLCDMNAWWKLLGQIVSTLPVMMAGCYVRQFILFGQVFDVGLLGTAWTIGWLVLGINALNLLDGVDGLASLMGIVISLAVGAIAATQNRPDVMLLAFALAGALGGFLVHNSPPARVYLGDCGSMVIGFTLALLALRVSLAPKAPLTVNVTVAAALLFVPLMDTALAIVRRTLRGCSFMVGDHSHVHHQLLKRGLSVWAVLGVLGGFGLTTGTVAWLVAAGGRESWGWLVLVMVTLLMARRRLLGYEEWNLARRFVAQTALPSVRRLSPVTLLTRLRPTDRPSTAALPSEFSDPVVLRTRVSPAEVGADVAEARKAA